MTNFKEVFKNKAKNKTLTAADMLALCVYKTINAKSEDKQAVLNGVVQRAFTAGKVCAHRPTRYHAVTVAQHMLSSQIRPGNRWMGSEKGFVKTDGWVLDSDISSILTQEQQLEFREQVAELDQYGYKMDKM